MTSLYYSIVRYYNDDPGFSSKVKFAQNSLGCSLRTPPPVFIDKIVCFKSQENINFRIFPPEIIKNPNTPVFIRQKLSYLKKFIP